MRRDKRGVITRFSVVRDGEDFELDVEATVYFGMPAHIGLPENSYPAEPDEVDYKLFLQGKPWSGTLSDAEDDELQDMLVKEAYDDEPDPPSDDVDYEDPFKDYIPDYGDED